MSRSEKDYNCYFELTLDIVGGKWKPIILYYLGELGVLRYSELKRNIPSINERMLTRQLKELEADKIIIRKSYNQVPPKVEYSLSTYGEKVVPILRDLKKWGRDYSMENGYENFVLKEEIDSCND